MKKKIVILLGLPGSGKGTQGKILSEELALPHISTGDIFRNMALGDSDDSKLLKKYMNDGKLVPNHLVNRNVRNFILSDKCKYGCILDGYPRTLDQAEYFLENVDADVSVIFFNVSDEIVKKRILGRITCSNCGAIYNKFFDKPKKDEICDRCGSQKFDLRSDDDEKTILSRIGEYRESTIPVINYYTKKSNFFTVSADKTKEEVMQEVISIAKKI